MYDVCLHHVTLQAISAILLNHQAIIRQCLQVALAKFRSISATYSILIRILLLLSVCTNMYVSFHSCNC